MEFKDLWNLRNYREFKEEKKTGNLREKKNGNLRKKKREFKEKNKEKKLKP